MRWTRKASQEECLARDRGMATQGVEASDGQKGVLNLERAEVAMMCGRRGEDDGGFVERESAK